MEVQVQYKVGAPGSRTWPQLERQLEHFHGHAVAAAVLADTIG